MKIGVPRERKTLEKRVALTPDCVAHLVRKGHQVVVENAAGEGSFFEDALYADAGATLVATLAEVWSSADLVVKVKEPHESEYQYFREGLIVFDYLHLASAPEVTHALLDSGVTSVAYELVKTRSGRLPLLEPMSEIAGKLSVLNGSYFLLSQNGGRGVLTGGAVGVAAASVVILGAGIAGRAACEIALGMGAEATVLDIDAIKLEDIKSRFHNKARTLFSTRASIAEAVKNADLVIGAVLIPGASAPKLITREMVKGMPLGSVIVDISVDQGGCIETTRVTSLAEPTFVEEGVIHYGVPNMPAQTPRTSTMALTARTLPYITQLADGGLAAIKNSPQLLGALSTHRGSLITPEVGESLGVPWVAAERVLQTN